MNCLFGLALNGGLITAANPYDPTGKFTCPSTQYNQAQPIPLEGLVGWDASLNGNLAELLQEPSLMGAYEGAAITVLGQGVRIPAGLATTEAAFPPGTVLLTNSAADCHDFPGNFFCNPSSVDGLTFTNSSQGGGGIWLHAWNHYMQIANNRVFNNGGTLSGGITIGQPEAPDAENGAVDGTSLIDVNTQTPTRFALVDGWLLVKTTTKKGLMVGVVVEAYRLECGATPSKAKSAAERFIANNGKGEWRTPPSNK